MSFSKAGAAEDGMEMLEAPLASGSSSVRSSTICVSTSFEFAEILMALARNRVNLGVEKAAQKTTSAPIFSRASDFYGCCPSCKKRKVNTNAVVQNDGN